LPSAYELAPKGQIRHARDQVASKVMHALLPWCGWILMTAVFGPAGLLLARWAWLTAAMTLLAGLGLAWFIAHLHANRASLVGKAIGPATAVAGSSLTAAWLLSGFSVPLALVWTMGGAAVCIGWDAWLHSAGQHELALAFGAASATAWGAAGQLSVTRPKRPRRGDAAPAGRPGTRPDPRRRARPTVTGRVQIPPDVDAEQAAEAMRRVEQGLQYPPGSATMRQAADNSTFGDFIAVDPAALEESEAWPGPSAPGADMSVPFRYGRYADGSLVMVPRLDVFHTRTMGQTGTAKTMGHGYCQLGEGVTRENYAALVMDISKGEQFFGAWRTALHQFETEEEPVMALLAGIHRARLARTNYMAKDHFTEWTPACRLSYLDVFLAEAPDIIRKLPSGKRQAAAGAYTLEDWQSDVKNARSAGESWNLDLQLALATEVPTVSQGQLSYLCMGVETPEEARVGLSSRQLKAGCRPDLWGRRLPGMAYWDAPTIDPAHGVMAMRFYHWTGGSRQAFEYAGLYPSIDRPLDDITAEALAWTPPVTQSLELPGPGGTLQGNNSAGRQPKAGGVVRPLFGGKGPRKLDAHDESAAAEAALWQAITGMMAKRQPVDGVRDGTFILYDLRQAGFDDKAQRSRTWLYDAMRTFVQTGRLELVADKPKMRWRMTVMPAAEQEEG
jgi:hypothetical protein